MIRSRGLWHAHPGGHPIGFPDVDLPQGHTLLLRGPSGSGKSTWLSLVAGLLRPPAGQLWVSGQDMGALASGRSDVWRARHVGLLPQRLHLSDALDVSGNLALVYFAAGLAVDRLAIANALTTLGVGAMAARRPQKLSGGEAQRVALARAVLLSPKVLLADEPTASLDDAAADAALALLSGTAQRCGASLVIATHDARVRHALPQAATLELAR